MLPVYSVAPPTVAALTTSGWTRSSVPRAIPISLSVHMAAGELLIAITEKMWESFVSITRMGVSGYHSYGSPKVPPKTDNKTNFIIHKNWSVTKRYIPHQNLQNKLMILEYFLYFLGFCTKYEMYLSI